MKLKQLESAIQEICEVQDFGGESKIDLEQYSTPVRLAAEFLFRIQDELQDSVVVDLGCGCGILSAGASVLGASSVLCIDTDQNCLDITKSHFEAAGIEADYLKCDVEKLNMKKFADIVLTNPPFGTRKAGIDWTFVIKSLDLADVVYSFHKTSTRKFFMKSSKELGIKSEVFMSVNFALPKMYKIHQKKSVNIEVDIWRFSREAS
jgi:predicted RNA methylase